MRRLALLPLLLSACARAPATTPEEAAARALAFLFTQQSADGGIRSDVHGVLKPGFSLTATVLLAVALLPEHYRAPYGDGIARAFVFLAKATGPDGAIGLGGDVADYPTYTSAHYLHALCLLQPPGWRPLADVQLAHLRSLQLGMAQGWQPDDWAYGAFGFGVHSEPKPLGAELVNLPLVTSVVEAARAAGVQPGDPLFTDALRFIERCQRFRCATDLEGDGGFFFTPQPEFRRSKAGDETGKDGIARGRSYGTTTCDGLRALHACGGSPRRSIQALQWLEAHTQVDRVPGLPSATPPVEPAVRLYWWATLGRMLETGHREFHLQKVEPWWSKQHPATPCERMWPELAARQRNDGAFVGLSDRMKEDDPIVATSLALFALSALCRD
jgi:hypothetical protein